MYPDYVNTEFLNKLLHDSDPEAEKYSFYASVGYVRSKESRIYKHERANGGLGVEELIEMLNGLSKESV